MRRALLLLPLVSNLAWAEPEEHHHHHHHHPEATATAPTVSPETYQEFQAIEALVAQSAYAEAERKIQALLPGLKDNPAAEALLLRNLATLYGMQKRYAQAAETLARGLALHALPAAENTPALLELARYYFAAEDYAQAAGALSAWLAQAPDPSPEHFLLLADIQAKLKRYPEAAATVEQAIARSPQPKPEWFELLVGLHHAAHHLPGCAQALLALIDRAPDHALHWNQLIGVYQEMGKDNEALAVRQLMYKRGMLKSSAEIVQLAQVLRYRGLYSRAAELLQGEIERGGVDANAGNLGLLADAWTEARELRKAAAVLEKAASLADTGEVQYRLGQTYSELRDWPKARQALERAVARNGLKNPGGAYLLLGMAHYRLNEKDQARAVFVRAQATPAFRNTAEQWLKHIDKETRQSRSEGAEKSG